MSDQITQQPPAGSEQTEVGQAGQCLSRSIRWTVSVAAMACLGMGVWLTARASSPATQVQVPAGATSKIGQHLNPVSPQGAQRPIETVPSQPVLSVGTQDPVKPGRAAASVQTEVVPTTLHQTSPTDSGQMQGALKPSSSLPPCPTPSPQAGSSPGTQSSSSPHSGQATCQATGAQQGSTSVHSQPGGSSGPGSSPSG